MKDYPLPESAAYIWTNGEKIFLTFPGYKGTEDRRFNTVVLDPKVKTTCTCKECGHATLVVNPTLEVLWDVLKSRSNSHEEDRKISSRATPTQYNIDEMLKSMKATRIEPKKDLKGKSVAEMLQVLKL